MTLSPYRRNVTGNVIFVLFFSICDTPQCEDEILQICKLAAAGKVSPKPEQVTPPEIVSEIVSSAPPYIEYNYEYEENYEENITSIAEESLVTSTEFSLFGLGKAESLAQVISCAVIVFCIASLLLFALIKFKKIKCNTNMRQRSMDIELQNVPSPTSQIYTPLVQSGDF